MHTTKPHHRACELGEQEERRARLVGPFSQSLAEVGVDGCEVQTIIDGQEDEGYGKIAQYEAEACLQIGHVGLEHHAGHRHEGNARDRCSHHAERHHVPR